MPYDSILARGDAAALVPEEVSNAMINSLQAQSLVLDKGNRIPISRNMTRFPVLSVLPQAYFVNGDTGLKQTTKAAWANKFMYVEEIATIVPIPEAVLDDAGFDVWAALQPLMERAIVRTFDAAVVFGTGAPATWAAEGSLVSKAIAAGNTVTRGTNNAAAGGIHGDLSDVVGKLEADGQVANGATANITLKARLRNQRDTAGRTLELPADIPTPSYDLAGLWGSGSGAAEYLAGDFSKLVVGVRQDMTYKLLSESVITDSNDNIILNLAQQDSVAMRLVFRAAYAVANPINDQQPTEGSRSAFSVLVAP